MVEIPSFPGLVVSILLPWSIGTALVKILIGPTARHGWTVALGHGFTVGFFVIALFLQLWNLMGLALDFWMIASCIALLLPMLGYSLRGQIHPGQLSIMPAWSRRMKIAIIVITLWVVWRYSILAVELVSRPVFAWDAWMNWSPKAVVWFYSGELVPFISPEEWLTLPGSEIIYTLGNRDAWDYPVFLPLVQLWSMLALDSHDNPWIYLYALFLPISVGVALFGHLRLNGVSVLASALAAYAVLNLPYINVHTALPGYADLWLASSFFLAAISLDAWRKQDNGAYAALAVCYALICSQLKIPGIVLGMIVLLVFIRSLARRDYRHEIFIAALILSAVAVIFILGIDTEIPGFGRLIIANDLIQIPVLGSYSIEFHDVSDAFLYTLFVSNNWNLLAYFASAGLLVAVVSGRIFKRPSDVFLLLLGATVFVAGTFYFTHRYITALDYTTLNRALLYIIPTAIYYAACAISTPTDPPARVPVPEKTDGS